MEKKYFASFEDLETVDILPVPMKRQIFFGDDILIGRNLLKANTLVPAHSHPQEQISYVESGECDILIDGKFSQHAKAGSIAWFPANAVHEIQIGPEDAVIFDIFHPVREDWLKDFEKTEK